MSTQGSSQLAFGKAAAKFNVAESDYLVMASSKISTFSELAFRFPRAEDFESYMVRILRTRGAYRSEDTIRVYDIASPVPREEYKESDDAACLRRLWTLAAKVAKSEVEALAGDGEEPKTKVSAPTASELEDSTVKDRKMPMPLGDRERPSLWTLTRVQQNFAPNGDHRHLTWESFVSMDTENRLRRSGKLPKDSQELVISGKAVTLQAGEPGEIHVAKIGDVTAMQEALELRARAFCMLGLASYAVYRRLTEFFVARLRDLPPEGFRAPTLNEIRKCDRVLHEDLLRFISKSVGTLDQGVSFHLDKPDHAIWKLVAHEVEGVPDKGLDPKSNVGPGGKPKKEEESQASGVKRKAADGGADEPPKARMCMICGKRHEPRCPIPEGWRKQQRENKKKTKAAGKGEKDTKTKA